MVSNIFYFHLYLGKRSNLTSIFFKWVEPPAYNPVGHFCCRKKKQCVALPISAATPASTSVLGLSLIRGDGGKTPKTKQCGDWLFGGGWSRSQVLPLPKINMPPHVRWLFPRICWSYSGVQIFKPFIILYGRPCKSNISEAFNRNCRKSWPGLLA